MFIFVLCRSQKQISEPDIHIHYLGHASFILQFDNGFSILTDHGTSNAWGLDSPIHEIENFTPDVATYSHTVHIDHFRGEMPKNVDFILTDTDSLRLKGIVIQPVRTSELSLKEKDNTSYLITYRGFTILHLGDAQANIKAISLEENRIHLKEIFPETIDLLLMTIGGRSDIIEQAESFIHLLEPKRIIPMHYWKREDKLAFLAHCKAQIGTAEKHYQIKEIQGAQYSISSSDKDVTPIRIISLEPEPFSQMRDLK